MRTKGLTKAQLAAEMTRVVETTGKESALIVETVLDSIVRSLRRNERVEVRGFGSFSIRQRRARIGRNPKTGARVDVPAKRIPYFRPSSKMKQLINAAAGRETCSTATTDQATQG
jgi:integration host factor subunit beta